VVAHPDGSYEAVGIFGQSILIDPQEKLIVVTSSAWPRASWREGRKRHAAFQAAVREATRNR
jgi:CubicO group peptidase (beta-lactamase class C family)